MKIKKWYFSINESGIPFYEHMIRCAVLSALKNTDLLPNCIYHGDDVPFLDWLRAIGVNVIRHKSSIYDAIKNASDTPKWNKKTAEGAYLRIDIPLIEEEEDYVLYTDCDVVFIKEIADYGEPPEFFSAAPEFGMDSWAYCNTGVLILNVKALRKSHEEFSNFCRNNLTTIPEMGVGHYDQAALNIFYKNKWSKLPLRMNWKPYWGYSDEAEIIHFHGPKPTHIKRMMSDDLKNIPDLYLDLFNRNSLGMAYSLGVFSEIERSKQNKKVQGYIDYLSKDRMIGWAIYLNDKINPVKINVFDGDDYLFSFNADLNRHDIFEKKGVKFGGFELFIPAGCNNLILKDDFGFPIFLSFNGKQKSSFNLVDLG